MQQSSGPESIIYVHVPNCGPLGVHQSLPVWIGPAERVAHIAGGLRRSTRLALHIPPADLAGDCVAVMDASGFAPRKVEEIRAWIESRLAGDDLPQDAPRAERVAQLAHDDCGWLDQRLSDQAPAGKDETQTGTREPAIADDSFSSPRELANLFNVPADALRQRLTRWRRKNLDGWIESADRGGQDAQFLYRASAVKHIIDEMRAAS